MVISCFGVLLVFPLSFIVFRFRGYLYHVISPFSFSFFLPFPFSILLARYVKRGQGAATLSKGRDKVDYQRLFWCVPLTRLRHRAEICASHEIPPLVLGWAGGGANGWVVMGVWVNGRMGGRWGVGGMMGIRVAGREDGRMGDYRRMGGGWACGCLDVCFLPRLFKL